MLSDKFETNVTHPFMCLWSRVWVYVTPEKQQFDHLDCEETEKLSFLRSQRQVFSHWIKQELHPIEIRQEAEMSQFVMVENKLPVS